MNTPLELAEQHGAQTFTPKRKHSAQTLPTLPSSPQDTTLQTESETGPQTVYVGAAVILRVLPRGPRGATLEPNREK